MQNRQFPRGKLPFIAFIGLFAVIFAVFAYHLVHTFPNFVATKFLVSCQNSFKDHLEVEINESGFSKELIEAKTCDELTFFNNGSKYHKIAFGQHEKHLIYPGYREEVLEPGEKIPFILNARGRYEIHDHFYEDLKGIINIH